MTPNNAEQRIRRSNTQLFKWTLSWVLSLALVAFAPKLVWDYAQTYTFMAMAVNVFFGYKMIMANKLHLEAMDELQRQIHMNAMAISLGISMVFGALYGLLEAVKIISYSPNPAGILFVMGATYIVSTLVNVRKYL